MYDITGKYEILIKIYEKVTVKRYMKAV